MDPLAVLTLVLGQSVPRGNGLEEFICGKCVSVLERVFKFDTVITRVRVLSRERLQKLSQERDNLRQWVRGVYRQRHPSELRNRGSSSEDDADLRDGRALAGMGRAYHDMLSDNMAHAAYECWSERSESCPYFKRTGKKCGKMKNCECCDSLRVSDSDYESVCGVPRHVPQEALSPFGLSRDKSQSLPFPLSKAQSPHSSPASLAGSCQSLQSQTRKATARSLDSLDGQDLFDWPDEHPVIFDSILEELRNIEGKPVRSPAGSRIPVLAKGQNVVAGSTATGLVRVLDFGEGDEDEVNGEHDDVLTELRDEFLPLQREFSTARMHLVAKHLWELDQAQAQIKTLEAGLQVTTQLNSSSSNQARTSKPVKYLCACAGLFQHLNSSSEDDCGLISNLSHSLQSREKIIQKLCTGVEEADKLVNKVAVTLTNTHSDKENVLEAELSELKEKEHGLQKKLEVLQQAARGRERDLLTLNTVLQCNQDVISHLRVELAENTRSLQDLQKERQLWKEHNSALEAMLQEKDSLISHLQVALEGAHKDAQTLSDSLIGRGLEGGGAEVALASQVREQEIMLSKCLNDWEQHTATTREEVSKLCTALENAEALIQDQSQKKVITDLSEQLRDARKELQETLRDIKLSEQGWKSEKAKRDLEEAKLRECLLKRDKLIEQVLLDAEKRDGMLIELQQNISSKIEPKVGLKHTL
ncbi:uncharacterized protein si:ch73-95l15.5 isoform X2 [Trichomycterus rosablanca]|uniref:uncharacterized protein si:ch73-95l15.5 isoform X2 n=1 Tax=Trichomycterus rosablanca TaxID=2290929 RepID=UPI002F35E987